MQRRALNPDGVVKPASHYAQAVEISGAGRWLHISGQIGAYPDGTVAAGYQAQARQTFANLNIILAAAGMSVADVVRITVFAVAGAPDAVASYRTERDAWTQGHELAATFIVVSALAHPDFLIEIEAIAAAAT